MQGLGNYCERCHGIGKLLFGAVLLLNAFVWPKWLGIDGWISFFAVLIVVGGFIKLVKPICGHCGVNVAMEAKKMAGKVPVVVKKKKGKKK